MALSSSSIWDKIDPTVIKAVVSSESAPGQEGKAKSPVNWRRRFRIANVIALVVWLFAFTKLFVFDIDRFVLERYLPSASVLLDYKFFILLGVGVLAFLVVKRSWLWTLYITFFPLVVLFWYIPVFLYRLKSWPLLIAVINLGYGFLRHFKRNLVVRAVEIFALLFIVVADSSLLLKFCIVVLCVALAFHYVVAVRAVFAMSRFLDSQRDLVGRLLGNKFSMSMITIDPALRDSDIERFSKPELDNFVSRVSAGIVLVRSVDLYIYALNRYRQTGTGYVLAFMSFAWLFVQSVAGLTFINYAIWRVDPNQFTSDGMPSFFDFCYASLLSLFANSASNLAPNGSTALLVGILAGIFGPVLLIAFLLQLYLGYRQSKDDQLFVEMISTMEKRKKELEGHLESDYEVSLGEALARLSSYGLGGAQLFVNLAARLSGEHGSSTSGRG